MFIMLHINNFIFPIFIIMWKRGCNYTSDNCDTECFILMHGNKHEWDNPSQTEDSHGQLTQLLQPFVITQV